MILGGRPLTIREVLAFTDHQYRLYTAIHEVGHAAAGLATGQCRVDACELTIAPGAEADGFTGIFWAPGDTAVRTQLIFLHGGFLAQEKWMRETGLWTPERSRAARSGAGDDFAYIHGLRADESSIRKACDDSRELLHLHWSGIVEAAQLLYDVGRITGQEICDLCNAHART